MNNLALFYLNSIIYTRYCSWSLEQQEETQNISGLKKISPLTQNTALIVSLPLEATNIDDGTLT